MPTATAGLGARIGARLLDVRIVWIPASIVLGLFGLRGEPFGLRGWLANVVTTGLWFGYYVLMESNQGATLGKRILNLRVVVADGTNPPVDVAAKRNVWMLFGLIPTWLGGVIAFVAVIVIMVTIASNADNRGYHDQFAGTAVMR
jgi:uncharacterized RDD family membrane protein YckC